MPTVQPIQGVHGTLAALKALDANVARQVNRAINKSADKVAQVARGLVDPQGLSGWQRQLPGGREGSRRAGYNPTTVAAGIKVKRRRPRRRGPAVQSFVTIANTSPAGAIWEIAGRRSDGKTPSGIAMVAAIRARGGPASRTVWAAADQTDMGAVQAEIRAHVAEAERLCRAAINRAS